MKNLTNLIQEKLQINSKTKLSDPDEKKIKEISNCLNCSKQASKFILDNYINLDILSKDLQKSMICTDFEALFMLASMLVMDNQEPDKILKIGTLGYKNRKNNPYDYSWFEEFYDENKDIDVLDQIKNEYKSNKDLKNKFIEIYDFCKDNNIINIDNIFNFYNKVNI